MWTPTIEELREEHRKLTENKRRSKEEGSKLPKFTSTPEKFTSDLTSRNSKNVSEEGSKLPKFTSKLGCFRCMHSWAPLTPNPKICPKCKSSHWQTKSVSRQGKRAIDDYEFSIEGLGC
jgi:hypothetical protein